MSIHTLHIASAGTTIDDIHIFMLHFQGTPATTVTHGEAHKAE